MVKFVFQTWVTTINFVSVKKNVIADRCAYMNRWMACPCIYPRRDKRTDIFYRLGWGGRRILAVTIKFIWSPLRLCSIIMTPLPPLPLSLRSIFYKPPFEDWSPLHSPETTWYPSQKNFSEPPPDPSPDPPPLPPQAIDIEWSRSPIKMRRLWSRVWYEYKRE